MVEHDVQEEFRRLKNIILSRFGDDLPKGDASFEASWLLSSIILNPIQGWNQKEELAKWDAFEDALKLLRDFCAEGLIRFGASAMHYPETVTTSRNTFTSDEALRIKNHMFDLLKPSIDHAREYVKNGPSRRGNWEGVTAIEWLRVSWWRCTGEEAPSRGLDEASPFGQYAQDVFEALQIPGNVRASMAAWVRYIDSGKEAR